MCIYIYVLLYCVFHIPSAFKQSTVSWIFRFWSGLYGHIEFLFVFIASYGAPESALQKPVIPNHGGGQLSAIIQETPRKWSQQITWNSPLKKTWIYCTSWWLNQPLWKICSSTWVHLPQIFGGEKFQKCLSCHHPDLRNFVQENFPPDPIITEFERFFLSQHLEGGLVPNKGNDGSYIIKMDDFLGTTIFGNTHICTNSHHNCLAKSHGW